MAFVTNASLTVIVGTLHADMRATMNPHIRVEIATASGDSRHLPSSPSLHPVIWKRLLRGLHRHHLRRETTLRDDQSRATVVERTIRVVGREQQAVIDPGVQARARDL